MGYGRMSSDAWSSYSTTTSAKPASAIFKKKKLDESMDPKGITRESRDSDENPNSTPIIIACDVTGSMGIIAENLVKKGIGVVFEEIYERKPVTDPHMMIMAVGDANSDDAPLQVSQFEADMSITDEIEKVYVEGNGGGNQFESYDLPLYFAAYHTSTDAFEKRGKKGYLFTIGDENPPPKVVADQIREIIGDGLQANMSHEALIVAAEEMYNYYHIIVAEGWYCRHYGADVVKAEWQRLLGQRAVVLDDYNKLSEVLVSIIEVNEGANIDDVVDSWSGDTALVVRSAVNNLTVTSDGTSVAVDEVVRF